MGRCEKHRPQQCGSVRKAPTMSHVHISIRVFCNTCSMLFNFSSSRAKAFNSECAMKQQTSGKGRVCVLSHCQCSSTSPRGGPSLLQHLLPAPFPPAPCPLLINGNPVPYQRDFLGGKVPTPVSRSLIWLGGFWFTIHFRSFTRQSLFCCW